MSVVLRKPEASEAAAMAALHVRCWQESYALIMPPEILARHDLAARLRLWRPLLVDDDMIPIAAINGGIPIGLAIAGRKRAAQIGEIDGQLTALYVATDWQGQGIGRSLLAQAARQWRERGGSSLLIEVLAENARARRFYEKLGARLLGIEHGEGRKLADAYYALEDLAKFDKDCQTR